MIEKSSLYLESTIPSYLAARPSRDLIVAAHQQITHDWWYQARERFDMYISEAVLEEISAVDPDAVTRRRSFVDGLSILALTDDVEDLAVEYESRLGLASVAPLDAVHLAYAAVYEMGYLLTWNCRHLANGVVIQRLQTVNLSLGRLTPVIVTPEELLEVPEGE